MNESSFDNLSAKDYSEKSREQTRMVGQKAAIRLIDTDDLVDMQRMDIIDKDKRVLEVMRGDPMSAADLLEWAKGTKDQFLFAVGGSKLVSRDEIGELQGWIQFHPEDVQRLQRMVADGIITKPNDDIPIFEISYAKLPEAPNKQIASGVRQALLMLAKEMERRDPTRTDVYRKDIFITAYVDPIKNQESVKVLEHCGFVKKGSTLYEEGEEREDDVYILDWAKLREIVDTEALEEMRGTSSSE